MSILVKTFESRLEKGNAAFYCLKNGTYTNLLVHTIVRWLSKGKVVERIWSVRKTWAFSWMSKIWSWRDFQLFKDFL